MLALNALAACGWPAFTSNEWIIRWFDKIHRANESKPAYAWRRTGAHTYLNTMRPFSREGIHDERSADLDAADWSIRQDEASNCIDCFAFIFEWRQMRALWCRQESKIRWRRKGWCKTSDSLEQVLLDQDRGFASWAAGTTFGKERFTWFNQPNAQAWWSSCVCWFIRYGIAYWCVASFLVLCVLCCFEQVLFFDKKSRWRNERKSNESVLIIGLMTYDGQCLYASVDCQCISIFDTFVRKVSSVLQYVHCHKVNKLLKGGWVYVRLAVESCIGKLALEVEGDIRSVMWKVREASKCRNCDVRRQGGLCLMSLPHLLHDLLHVDPIGSEKKCLRRCPCIFVLMSKWTVMVHILIVDGHIRLTAPYPVCSAKLSSLKLG